MSEGTGGTAVAREAGGLSRIPFSASAEAMLRSLAVWMSAAGWIHLVLSVGDLLNMFATKNPGVLVNALLKIVIGVWSIQAAQSFRMVATTDRADQAYLVQGFRKLHSIFLLQAVLVIISLVLVVAAFIVALIVALAHR